MNDSQYEILLEKIQTLREMSIYIPNEEFDKYVSRLEYIRTFIVMEKNYNRR